MSWFNNKIQLSLFLVCLGPLSLFALDPKYPVSAIPTGLLKNADLVVRLDETTLEILNLSSTVERIHLVYTVLRESASEKAFLTIFYDQDSKITGIEGKIYDAEGRQTDRIRTSDIIDQSAVPSGTLYSDDRLKHIRPLSSTYPYTVEYVFERTSRKLMQYPIWYGVNEYNTSVENASLLIRAKNGFYPRTLTENFPRTGQWPVKKNDSSLFWEIRHFPALLAEPLAPDFRQMIPSVSIAPAQVLIPGQESQAVSWKTYGQWVNRLNQERGELPGEVKVKIHQLTSMSPDPLTKMKAVYQYFQENTRYISVQIGIGGYQPAKAEFVARHGYGDCKALVNYLKALLESAGIHSYYALVRAGKKAQPIRTAFPSLQFNHAILCVPVEKDTIWLECTSQTIPFGFLGSFTDNRDVLLVTPDGGVIAHTPSYPIEMNNLARKAVIDINAKGNAHISVCTRVSGLPYELLAYKLKLPEEEQKKAVREEIEIPTVNITRISYSENPATRPEATENLELDIPAYTTLTGHRIFIPLNPFNRLTPLSGIEEPRKFPFVPEMAFNSTDSILFRLPAGFTPVNLPDSLHITTIFGNYLAKSSLINGELLYVRQFSSKAGEFLPEQYAAYHAFNRQISKADKNKAVITNQE